MTAADISPAAREAAVRRRRTFMARSAVILILGPALLYALYLFIAPARYEATATFAVRDSRVAHTDALSAIGLVTPTSTSTDARIVEDFIRSPAMVAKLRQDYDFNGAYSPFRLDPIFSRVSGDASLESATRFWRRQVHVQHDIQTGATTLAVRAYDKQSALRLARGVMAESERLVNTMSDRAVTDLTADAAREVEMKREEYEAAQQRLADFQGRRQAIPVDAPAQQAIALVGQLDAQLAAKRTELASATQTYQPNAPQLAALRREIAALETERQQAVNNALQAPGSEAVGGEIEAQAVLLDYQAAQAAYQAAVQARDAARRQDQNARKYVIAYVAPTLPSENDWFARFGNVLAVLIAAAILWSLAALVYSIIRDHME